MIHAAEAPTGPAPTGPAPTGPAPSGITPTGPRVDRVGVLLVEDHQLLAQTVAIALELDGVRAELAPLHDAGAVVAAAEAMPADLVLLDLDLGGAIGDGTRLVADLVGTGARVLALAGSTDELRIAAAVEQGAIGALRKDVAFDELLATTVAAARGQAVMDLQHRRDLLARARAERRRSTEAMAPFQRLSAREGQVLRELAEGRGVAQIAEGWFVAEATVRTQVRGVLTKLGVGSQLEAVALARRVGWLYRSSEV